MKQARMAKVLGCLIAAMTIGAAGLMWIEPHMAHRYAGSSPRASGPYMLRAERLTAPQRWQGLLIEHRFDKLGPLPLSSHPSELSRHHFIVDSDGFLQTCPAWRSHSQFEGSKEMILVAVQARPHASTMSMQQWESLLTLLRFAQEKYQLDGSSVRLQPRPSPPTPVLERQAEHLAAMLRAVGLFR